MKKSVHETKLMAIGFIASTLFGAMFLSFSLTGRAVGSLDEVTTPGFGFLLFILGIAGLVTYVLAKKR